MRLEIRATLKDVYGGDGYTRVMKVDRTRLKRIQKTKRTRNDIGSPSERSVQEQQLETKDEPVHTFRRNEDGTPTLRLGGPSGKMGGAIKEADKYLRMFEDGGKMKLPMEFIRINPVFVPLEGGMEPRVEGIAQILKGFGAPMVVHKFDVIGEAKVTFVIDAPEGVRERLMKALDVVQTMALFNKRRTTISFDSVKEL